MVLALAGIAIVVLYMSSKNKNSRNGESDITPSVPMTRYVEPWLPYPFTVFNGENQRSPKDSAEVIRQFNVANNSRYIARDEKTYCNIFPWDFTCAMGCEIPHWVDVFRNRVAVGRGSEQTANGIVDWLNAVGAPNGWVRLGEYEARQRAVNGYPTLVLWKNQGGIGHMAVVFPNSDTTKTYIAQAGARCFENEPLSRGFGNRENLQFWSHD